jgi:hypothetical protein
MYMKISLFKKKEITKKQAGSVFGGEQTIGERHTGGWNLFWGYTSDTEPYTDGSKPMPIMQN